MISPKAKKWPLGRASTNRKGKLVNTCLSKSRAVWFVATLNQRWLCILQRGSNEFYQFILFDSFQNSILRNAMLIMFSLPQIIALGVLRRRC